MELELAPEISVSKEAFVMKETSPEVSWTHSFLKDLLHQIPVETTSLLDVGCGRGIIGALMRIYRSPRVLVGVDVFDEYLAFCKAMGFYDKVMKHDLRQSLPFRDNEFEVSTCVEVIEHLDKRDGTRLLGELERVSETVIVTAPTKFVSQRAYDNNLFQRHACGWSADEFTRRGYTVFGVGEFLLFGSAIKYLSFLLSKFSYRMPQFSSTIMAVKLNKGREICSLYTEPLVVEEARTC